MRGARQIRHKWIPIPGNSIDKQCEYCGLIKQWEDTMGRFMFRDLIGLHYNRPECIYPPNSKT